MKRPPAEYGALDLAEEAANTLRLAGPGDLACYFLGTAPFVVGLMYFFADVSSGNFAAARLPGTSLAMALLYVWMKAWQAVFASRLTARAGGEPPPALNPASWLRTAVNQTIIQATGLVTLPITLLILAPFGYTYAFYLHASALDDGKRALIDLVKEAARHAAAAPKQCHLLIWLLSPVPLVAIAALYLVAVPVLGALTPAWTSVMYGIFALLMTLLLAPLCPVGMLVAVNVASALTLGPMLLRMFLGIETPFTVNPGGLLNPVFLVIVCGLVYLVLDPWIRTAFALRTFYTDSRRTGDDLRLRLARIRRAPAYLALILSPLLLFSVTTAHAQEAQTSVALGEALDEILAQPEFSWRLPRDTTETPRGPIAEFLFKTAEWFSEAREWVEEKIERVIDWFRRIFGGRDRSEGGGGGTTALTLGLRGGLAVVTVVIVLLIARILYQSYLRRRQPETVAESIAAAEPDIASESTGADELPEDGWLRLARELAAKGELRLAMRARFFALLVSLAEARLIRLNRTKSNREYLRELTRYAHAQPALPPLVRSMVDRFEGVWYGLHSVTEADLEEFAGLYQKAVAHEQ